MTLTPAAGLKLVNRYTGRSWTMIEPIDGGNDRWMLEIGEGELKGQRVGWPLTEIHECFVPEATAVGRLLTRYAVATAAELVKQTAMINSIADDMGSEVYRDRHMKFLADEQARRSIPAPGGNDRSTLADWLLHYMAQTTHGLQARTAGLRLSDARGHALHAGTRFEALEIEQARRCVSDVAEARDQAGREDLARELAAEGNRSAQAYVARQTAL